jgi:AcrR family transcriptional regulator
VSLPTAEPASRRRLPAKAPLNREAIVTTAIDLLRAEGLERVTMRRLAAALDTGAASLYVYFRSAEHLHMALLDALLGDVDLAPVATGTAWQDRLAAVLASYAGVLFSYPSVARLSVFTRPNGPNGLRLFEMLLALLDEGGVAPATAAWGSDQLVAYATSTAAEHGARDERVSSVEDETAMARGLDSLSVDTHPHLYRVRGTFLAGEEGERFRWGIDVLLAGLQDRRNDVTPGAYVVTDPATSPGGG